MQRRLKGIDVEMSKFMRMLKTIFVWSLVLLGVQLLSAQKELPLNTFLVTYHNYKGYKEVTTSVKTERSNHAEFVGHTQKLFHDKYKDFNLEMEGVFEFAQDTNKTFHFNLTWSGAELFVDGVKVGKTVTTGSHSVHHLFKPGRHHVRIFAYNADSAYVKMSISISDYEPVLKNSDVVKKLEPLFAKDINVYYTSAWSDKKVHLLSSSKPTVLFISSRQGISWEFSNAKGANLQAIVYSGVGDRYKVDKADVPRYRAKRVPLLKEIAFDRSKCQELPVMGLQCSGSPDNLNRYVRSFIGRNITGFTKATKKSTIYLPEQILDEKAYKRLYALSKDVKVAKTKVKAREKNPFYEKGDLPWSKILHVKDVPKNIFRAYYMDATNPTKVIYSETVQSVTLNFDREKFHGIDANHFSGLWVGDFYFNERSTRVFNISLSWAQFNLIVDGKSLYKGSHSKIIEHIFEKGVHRVEVEYNSNYWHVGFLFNMQEKMRQLTAVDVSHFDKNLKVFVVGAYSSSGKNNEINLFVKKYTKPCVLVLNSYEPVKWNILHARSVKAVIFNSYSPGSSVVSDNSETEIYADKRIPYVSRVIPYCYDKPMSHCENKYAFTEVTHYIQKIFGKRADGFSSVLEPTLGSGHLKRFNEHQIIVVPQMELDAKMYQKIREKMKTLE